MVKKCFFTGHEVFHNNQGNSYSCRICGISDYYYEMEESWFIRYLENLKKFLKVVGIIFLVMIGIVLLTILFYIILHPFLMYDCYRVGVNMGLPSKLDFGTCYVQYNDMWVVKDQVFQLLGQGQ